jgi:hypothetical protein
MTSFRAAPSMACNAPSRAFRDAQTALQYAQEAANVFRVGYGVHRVSEGRPVLLSTIRPQPQTTEKP